MAATLARPVFNPGAVALTRGAEQSINRAQAVSYLRRHITGDWGVMDAEDQEQNNRSVKSKEMVMSAYPIDPEVVCNGHDRNTIWVITDAGHEVTTILLPEEY